MSELLDLAKSDPEKLKSVAKDVAGKLREEASNATGETASQLSKMADAFSKVAETGDLIKDALSSALKDVN